MYWGRVHGSTSRTYRTFRKRDVGRRLHSMVDNAPGRHAAPELRTLPPPGSGLTHGFRLGAPICGGRTRPRALTPASLSSVKNSVDACGEEHPDLLLQIAAGVRVGANPEVGRQELVFSAVGIRA